MRHRPFQGKSNVDFLGVHHFPDAGEAVNGFWSMLGSFIYRHHVEPRVKLYSPRDESFQIPLTYIDVSRTTHTNLDVKQEKRIDDYGMSMGLETCQILGQVSHNLLYWKRNHQTDLCGRSSMARALEVNGKHAKLKEKQKWLNEKPQLEIYFIDPEDKEFKETIKKARKKLETLVVES